MIFFMFIALFCGFADEIPHFVVPTIAVIFRTLYIKKSFSLKRTTFLVPLVTLICILLVQSLRGFEHMDKQVLGNFFYIKLPISMLIVISLVQNNLNEFIENLKRLPLLSHLVYFAERSAGIVKENMRETQYTSRILYKYSSTQNTHNWVTNLKFWSSCLVTILYFLINYSESTSLVTQARGKLPPISEWKEKQGYGKLFGDIILITSIFALVHQGMDGLIPKEFLAIRQLSF